MKFNGIKYIEYGSRINLGYPLGTRLQMASSGNSISTWVSYGSSIYYQSIFMDNGTGFILTNNYTFAYPTIHSYDGTYLFYTTSINATFFINVIKKDGTNYCTLNTSRPSNESIFYFFSRGLVDYIYVIPKKQYILRY